MERKASRRRHLAKPITFVYVVFGDIKAASGIMVAESILKMVLYYFHERAWFRYGSIGRKDDE